jgi:dienelactone hydrolase
MKMTLFTILAFHLMAYVATSGISHAQTTAFPVTADKAINGTVKLDPALQAAAPSYGVFGGSLLNHYSDDPAANDAWKDAIAPLSNIPNAQDRAVPHYLIRGTNDPIIKDEAVKQYVDALVKAGQRVEYVQAGGASHAFFDWKPDEMTKATFAKYGAFYCADMEAFFNSVFYK